MTAGSPSTAPHRGARGEYRKSARRRVEIVDAALEVFGQQGFRAGSLREIAERVGLTEAGVLHHFPSKRALLLAVLEQRDTIARSVMRESGESVGPITLTRAAALAQINADAPGVVELFSVVAAESTAPDHPAHDYFVDRYASVRADMRAAYEELASRGHLAEGVSVEYATASTIAIMDGLQIQWLLDRSSVDMVALLREHLQHLVTIDLFAPPA